MLVVHRGEFSAEPQTVGKSETILNETNQAGQVLVNATYGSDAVTGEVGTSRYSHGCSSECCDSLSTLPFKSTRYQRVKAPGGERHYGLSKRRAMHAS